ncbi:MAG: tRNA lysidine(34) synthetase TilS [Deltaproteobacteria bacterium]|nr:tRNA lysidine(34) synthetase TilS [Deltaproteobacteria bacterium]
MILGEISRCLAANGVTLAGESIVVVACSGGADSVALAAAAAELLGSRRVVLGHFDHAVRTGSELDAKLVEIVGGRLGADVRIETGVGLKPREAELREARYAALERIRADVGATLVLTAHTRDDQAETVLLRLIRGASDLRGMRERSGLVVRPLLHISRSLAREFAASRRMPFTDDPSNLEPRFLRNRIRKELLPLLESRYRPRITERLASGAERPRVGPLPRVRPEPPVLPMVGIRIERIAWAPGCPLSTEPTVALFDAATLPGLRVRGARPGDRIAPLGMTGHRKLQDIFVDAKVPRERRWGSPVLVADDDEVLWIPGLVRSTRSLVGPDTREVWRVVAECFSQTSTCSNGSVPSC